MSVLQRFAIGCGILTMTACASLPTTAFDRSEAQRLKVVALAPIGMPEKASTRILVPIGVNFGLIGAVVEETRAANAANELKATLAAANFDYQADIQRAMSKALADAGFTLKILPGPRNKDERGKFLKALPTDTQSDAVLDVYVLYVGFLAAGSETDYRPSFEVAAKLTDLNSKKVLFQDYFVYAATHVGIEKAIVARATNNATFANRGALQADPQATSAALHAAIDAVALELAKQFR